MMLSESSKKNLKTAYEDGDLRSLGFHSSSEHVSMRAAESLFKIYKMMEDL